MICESCQENAATVHLTVIEQKYKKQTHLCETCAKDKGVPQPKFSVKEFLGGLGQTESPKTTSSAVKVPAAPPPCTHCGMTFANFRATGRLGCHHDYEHFRTQLNPLLEKIHGTIQHRGRVPSRIGERVERERLVAIFQRELEGAVAREDYEKAAELRDKIRELEVLGERS